MLRPGTVVRDTGTGIETPLYVPGNCCAWRLFGYALGLGVAEGGFGEELIVESRPTCIFGEKAQRERLQTGKLAGHDYKSKTSAQFPPRGARVPAIICANFCLTGDDYVLLYLARLATIHGVETGQHQNQAIPRVQPRHLHNPPPWPPTLTITTPPVPRPISLPAAAPIPSPAYAQSAAPKLANSPAKP